MAQIYKKFSNKRRISFFSTTIFLLLLCSVSNSSADVFVLNAGDYETPNGWYVLNSYSPIDMRHGAFYIVGLPDWAIGPQLNVVFHDIYNENLAPNFLEVYVFDNPGHIGWAYSGEDAYSTTSPDWTGVYGATSLGVWSDADGNSTMNDLVFTISDPILLASLVNGGLFGVGIDPDCRFFGDRVTVEVPVPEPASILLFGSGLIGAATIISRRKKS